MLGTSIWLMNSAGVLIWQGSVRTKKTISVEEKLRTALQLPIAIAIPRTQDGTVIAGHNKAPLPEGSETTRSRSAPQDDETDESAGSAKGEEQQMDKAAEGGKLLSPRRTTITIGSTGEKIVPERQRAETIHAPGHEPSLLDQFERDGPPHLTGEPEDMRK